MDKFVVVIAETEQGQLTLPSLECVEEGRDVADQLGAQVHVMLCGNKVAQLAETLAAHGADRVTVVEHEALAQFSADGWMQALAPVLLQAPPALLLAPDSGQIRSWLPRLAVRWRSPLVGCCMRIGIIGDGYPEIMRSTHGGACQERLTWPYATLVCAMLIPGVRGIGTPQSGRIAETKVLHPQLDPAHFRDRTLHTLPADPRTVSLNEAERIVSGGFGTGGKDGMALVKQLADQLGAALGGTRVAADRGWLAVDRYIGSTGQIVAPKLYMAFGVSGADQHLSGITGSEIVIAINNDRTAPILKRADLGVVGDLHEILPILLSKLQALARTSNHSEPTTPTPTHFAVDPVETAS